MTGFEPAAPSSRTKCATKLRHIPRSTKPLYHLLSTYLSFLHHLSTNVPNSPLLIPYWYGIGTKLRTPKGTVAIENNRDRLRLRWSFDGEHYCLVGIPHNKINLKVAQKIASQIELDILGGYFDTTLDKYRTNSVPIKSYKSGVVRLSDNRLLPLWNDWVNSLNLSERTRNGHYRAILRHIEKNNPLLDDVSWFQQLDYSPRIFNDYLRYLNNCMRWAIGKGIVKYNPYLDIKRRKVVKNPIQPFNTEESIAIIDAFRNNIFCPKSSAYLHSHYADYVEFLFLTGCRPSEAIGLQRQHINLERNEIIICSVLGRGDRSSN